MGAHANYLAIDLGASGGRGMLGTFDGTSLALRELHRFPNHPVELPTGLHWDAPGLFQQIKRCLALAAGSGAALAGVGVDTWGVDYGLLSADGELLAPPRHYRDPRTRGVMDEAFRRIARERIYETTGIQFLPFNTLYQLLADRAAFPGRMTTAATLLFMPDLFHYWLTGVRRTEHSIASTSQMYDPASGAWAAALLSALELPETILPEIAEAGTPIGPLLPALAEETGAGPAIVIAPASHDTASAVAAVPGAGDDWAYISSGTWSLVGRELTAPIRTPEAMAENFTNERGVAGTIRFHKNIAGLWLLQECQRVWAAQGRAYTFEQLCEIAAAATPLAALVDPDDTAFAEFGDMPARLRAHCSRTGQIPPESDGAMVRCILESLSLKCAAVIRSLESLTGPIRTIHVVGGGAQNSLLCQFTANAAARPVLAGPVEATAIGNIMSQSLAHREVSSLTQIRQVIAASFRPARFDPLAPGPWAAARDRFAALQTM